MNCRITDNFLCLPIGTKFYINKQQGFVNKQISLINGNNENVFFAIFDENDVDFEICCDNRESDHGIGMSLTINQKSKSYYIRPHKLSTFKALETNGRKLHFISQNSNDGRVLVAQTAHKYGISFESAEIKCSRIEFAIDVEQCKNKVYISPFNCVNVTLIGTIITVVVKTPVGKIIAIDIGLDNTVNDLKMIIDKQEGIPRDQQILIFGRQQIKDLIPCDRQISIFGGKPVLRDIKKLVYYINEKCPLKNLVLRLDLVLRQKGGCLPTPLTELTDETLLPVTDKTDSIKYRNSKACDSNGSQLFSGERGVICYGEQSKSNQQFTNYYGFIKEYDLLVNSFVIEM